MTTAHIPFREVPYLPQKLNVERRGEAVYLSNGQPLKDYPPHMLAPLKYWAEHAPDRVWLAQRDPYGDSALGYYTHSADLLRNEDYAAALDMALQPIVFSTPNPPDKLAHCYAVAISAALGLRNKDYALTLHTEMQERELTWPETDPTFEEFFKQLNQHLEKLNRKAENEPRRMDTPVDRLNTPRDGQQCPTSEITQPQNS